MGGFYIKREATIIKRMIIMEKEEHLKERQALRLLEQAKGKSIILTHIADPDGMFCGIETYRLLKEKDDLPVVVVPIDHYFLQYAPLSEMVNTLDFTAVLDLPPFGRSIRYYCDHHQSSQERKDRYMQEGRISHCFFDAAAPSCLEMVKKMAREIFDREIDEQTRPIVLRCDAAKYETPAPTTWEEFDSGDAAWRYTYLLKTSNDSPADFMRLFTILLTSDPDEAIASVQYHDMIGKIIDQNARVKALASRIKPEELTIVVGNDDSVVNRGLMFRLYDGKCKVTVMMARSGEQFRVGFGVDPALGNSEADRYRVDIIANELGGGGHKRASGASIAPDQVHAVIQKIKDHFKTAQCLVFDADTQ